MKFFQCTGSRDALSPDLGNRRYCVFDKDELGDADITQERFNEKMNALDRNNPAPLQRLLARTESGPKQVEVKL